ncbi:PREDICTED: uncharacterized protein LOC104822858 isoform X2 [Tarenaya hassleriana]|uniref:uncharacterized protein LOC104822858 isoform X2 n=1 Tax=Tarenaya hassleriana TaxID=28532 RepID=UPI00053C613A|nr:PREDICTED: uncharacterized protein LOC104822858 isoform X2 [Tarenaya hassleriana]
MSETEMKFCSNYFLVDAKKAGFLDLLLLLITSDLAKIKFIDCPSETVLSQGTFTARCIIAITVFLQKVLISMRKPFAVAGERLTFWLNTVDINGGLFKLILRVLTGKTVNRPDKSSAAYTSVIGSTDMRVELDEKMSIGTDEYKAMLSIMASKIAYESEAFITSVVKEKWKMDYLGFFECYNAYQAGNLTQAFMFQLPTANSNLVVVSFRGTEPFDVDDWCTDLDIDWYDVKVMGKVHGGFMKGLGLQINGWPKEIVQATHKYAYYTIRQKLRGLFEDDKASKFIVTGHSLGGALAALFPAILALHDEDELLKRLDGVYTFGQPRVGDETFEEFMKDVIQKHDFKYARFVYSNDIVPRVPFDDKKLFGFKHIGPCIYFNSLYKEQILEDAPNKNYFNVLRYIPMMLNAAWELTRSFIIQFWKGKDYKENWFMRLARVAGLIFPGIVNHFPPDYVNSTRLG